jgi:hypothetical protein
LLSTTATGPGTAPSGTRTSTEVLRRTLVEAATSSSEPSAPRNTTSSAFESVFPRTRSSEPGRTAPATPQRWAHASFATVAGLEATGAMATGVATGTAVPPVGACARAIEGASQPAHTTATYAVVRRLRPTFSLVNADQAPDT